MKELLLRILGIDGESIPADPSGAGGVETQFMFTNPYGSWLAVVLVVAVAAVLWGVFMLYRHEMRSCPPGARLLLGALRAAVLVVLVLVLLGPALGVFKRTTRLPTIVVLLDGSQSMAARDAHGDELDFQRMAEATGRELVSLREAPPTRAAVAEATLRRSDNQAIRDLAGKAHVRVMTFATSVQPVTTVPMRDEEQSQGAAEPQSQKPDSESPALPPEPLLPEQPTGQGTNLAKAIREALRQSSSGPLAAIVLVSDGQHTAIEDDALAAADAAREANVPIFTIGVGDDTRPRTLRVVDVVADNAVWRTDPFEIKAIVQAQGFEAGAFQVELLERLASDDGTDSGAESGRVVASRNITLTQPTGDAPGGAEDAAAQETIGFSHKSEVPGRFIYTIRVRPAEDVPFEGEPAGAVPIHIMIEKARVLMIAGSPSHEYQYLTVLLTRDKTIDLSCWLQSMDLRMRQEGNTVIEQLPQSPSDLFGYDAVILLDPDPREFNEAWVEAIKTFLGEHGGGLLYQAGPRYSSRFLTSLGIRNIRDVLPVRIGDLAGMEVRSLLSSYNQQWPFSVVKANLDHPIMRFEPDPAFNEARWQRMPGVYWSFPADGPKPATRVLLEHGNPSLVSRMGAGPRDENRRPLLVSGQYGPGRTVWVGFDSTWRWRRVPKGPQYFEKFWVQSVRYLVEGRLLKGKRRGEIELSGNQYRVGDAIEVRAKLYDANYKPLDVPGVQATLKAPAPASEPQVIEMTPVADRAGEYEGVGTAAVMGLNEISITLPAGLTGDSAAGPATVNRQFNVVAPDVESRDRRLNRVLLRDVAERAGGRYFEINEAGAVAALVADRRETTVEQGKPILLWDTSRLLILLVILLTIEWAVRKRYRLL